MRKPPPTFTTLRHGQAKRGHPSATYRAWSAMKGRCCNPNNPKYGQYGGCGVTVCERWLKSFEVFFADMGERPSNTSLDRWPDPFGNYAPSNCRWATPKEQAWNRRSNNPAVLEFRGVRGCLTALCERFGQDFWRVRKRLRDGWPMELAMTAPNHWLRRSNRCRVLSPESGE